MKIISTWSKHTFRILLIGCFLSELNNGSLIAQCAIGPTLNLPDASSQPVLNPPNPYCTTINIDPAVTGHPIGLQMMLEHDWQGDLSIRINACGGTLMLLTRPGGGSCAGGSPFGSSADIGTSGNPALISFSDGGGPNPDILIPITGGSFGLSPDPCGANNMLNSFAGLAGLCGSGPYTIQVCITDHAGVNGGIATNIRPMFPGSICGCTDPAALNYYPAATINDGSCTYPPPVSGCTDPAALNYNPAATVNDGSCIYPPPPLTCGSVFYDTGGASGNYSNNTNATTTICPTNPGDAVTVTFTSFDVEPNWDKLYVYNGPNAASPQISSGNGVGSGSACSLPGGFWGTSIPGPFTSTHPGGCLTFVFCSDGSLTYSGWAANITCSTPCTPPAAPTASGQTIPPNTSCSLTASGCGGTLRWYNAPSGGTLIGTGSPFVTPLLSSSTTYYVECDSGSGCASNRTPVTVTVQSPPAMPSCGTNTWNVSVYADNTYSTFMGFYNTPGHNISPGDGGNDPLDIEFNVGKDGVPVNGFPSQANGYTGLPVTNEDFSIRAERCGFPCGAYYYINVRAFDDHVTVRVDQTGDGTYEFVYTNGPPRSTTPTDIWNGFLGPNSRVIIEGYNIGPGHPLYVSPNEFFLHVAFYNDQNHPLLTADAGTDASFCSPGSVNIGGTPAAVQGVPGYTYNWSPAGTLNNSGIANPTASPVSPTTYILTVTDARGCTDTDDVTVTPMVCCSANAGSVAVNPNPPCPGGMFMASATGQQTSPGYTQTYILTNSLGQVLSISPSGSFTMPAACGAYSVYSYNYLTAGTAITNPTTIGQIVCQPTHCCDLSAPLDFTTSATVSMPPNGSSTVACPSAATAPVPPNVMYSCGGLLARTGPVVSPDPACAGVKTYTWTYTDACNNQTYNWVYTYTISAPTVTMPAPGSSTVSCVSAAVPPTPPNVTDNCGRALTPSSPVVSPDPACAGTKTYTWTYTDCANNTYNWVYTYTISTPTVSLPAPGSSTVSCPSAAVAPTPPNVTDNCGRSLTPSGPVISPDPACSGTKTFTWTYTDCANNTYNWVYTYTISTPTVSLPAPGSSTVSCPSAAVAPTPPNVTDNCGRSLTPSGPVVSPDPACAGTKTYTWTYTDCAGNAYNWVYTYTISAPTVSLPAPVSSTVSCPSAAMAPTPPSVTDNCGRSLAPSGPVVSPDPACAGTKTYTWTYTDCAGNAYNWVYTYTISAPTVSLPAPGSSTVSCPSAAVAPTPPSVTDNCGRSLTPSGPVVSPDPACAGTKTYTWTYTDCAGNAYNWVYTYTIIGGTGGALPPNGAAVVACVSAISTPTPPVVNDNCGNPMSVSGPMATPNPVCGGVKTYTWTYTDCQSNTYQWSFNFTVQTPTFSLPSDQTQNVACIADAQAVPARPTVLNSCGVPLAVSGPVVSPNPVCSGAKTYTWTYTNCDGSSAAWTFTYIVAEPVLSLSCPSDQAFCRSASSTYTIPPAFANSSCGGAVPISYAITGATNRSGNGNNASGNFNVGQSIITWQTGSSCGTQQQCVTMVTIQQEPQLSLVSISCAADLNSYQVVFSSTGGTMSVSPLVGTLSGNSISGIPTGTNITLTATDNGCPSAPLSITAPDCSCPPITAPMVNPATATICAGDPIPTFTANVAAGLSVSWYATAVGGTALLANSLSFTPVAAGTYYAEAFDPATNCRSATRTTVMLSVTATQTPVFTQVQPICVGGNFSLSANSTNGIAGIWSPGINNTTTTTYTFTPNFALHPCAIPTTMTVTVNPIEVPVFSQLPPICAGGSFSLPATSNNGISGSWLPAVNNTTTTTYTFTPSAAAHPCAVSTTMTVPVNPTQTPTFTQVPPICAGGSFSLPATSNNGIAGIWLPAINNSATTTYTFTPNFALHPCAIPTTMTVPVNPTQTPTFTQVPPICAGANFSLPATSNNGIAGSWSPTVNNTTTTTYTFTPNAAAHPCAVTTTMTVQVDAQPALTIGSVSCAPDLLTYSVSFTATGGTVSATAGTISGSTVTGIPAGTDVAITVSNGTNTACDVSQNVTAPDCNCPPIAAPTINPATATICAGAPIPTFTASVPAGLTVIWYDAATGGTVLLANNLSFTPTAAGTYFAEAFDATTGCRSATRTQVTLTINPTQTPSFTQVPPICAGGTFSLPATSNNGIAGIWSPAVNNTTTTTYTFTPNAAAHPCAVTTTMTVQVDAQPALTIGAVTCAPDLLTYSVNFTATGGTVSATAGTISGSTVTGIPAGTDVAITVSNGTNTACDVSQTVTAPDCNCPPIAAPTINPATATICAGAPIPNFTASVPAGLTVIWYDAATGGTVLLANNLSFTPTAAGTYFAEAFDATTGCRSATRTQATLTINPTQTPSFTQVPPICAGANFSLPATSNNGIAGSWSPAVNNTTTTTYTFTPNAAAHPCAVTTTMTVQVDAQPALTIGAVSCAPDLLTYSVNFTATGGTVSATAGTISGNTVTGIPAGTDVAITVSNGTNTTCDVSQNVTAPDCNCPPIAAPMINPATATICAGAPIPTFMATVPAGLTVIWYDAATGGTVLLPNNLSFTPTAAGTYFAEAFDATTGCRSATRTPVTLTINPTQTPVFTQVPPICAGANFSLPATSNNGITGSWSPAVNNTTTTTYTFTPTAAAHPCAVTTTMTVQVDAQPTLTIGTVACAPDLLTYSVSFTATGGTVSATAGTISGSTVTGIPAGTDLTITVSNGTNTACDVSQTVTAPDCNCPPIAAPTINPATATICSGAPIPSFTASVPTGLTVIWYDAATGGTVLLANNLSFTPTAAGTYFAEAFDATTGCRSATRTSVTLTINPTQTPTFTQVPPICAGVTFSLPASSNNGIAGSWSPAVNNTATTTYTFTPNAAAHPCAVTTTMTVLVTPLPVVSAVPVEICAGQSATISASGGSFYLWSTGQMEPSITVMPGSTTSYSVTVTSEGCSSVASATVTVHPLPVPAIVRSADVICAGASATLTASGGNTYVWSTGEQTPSIVVSPTSTVVYSVTVADQRGCVASASTSIQVNTLPAVVVSAENLGCYGEPRGSLVIEQISGGLPPYSYAIGNEPLRSAGTLPATAADNLAPGTYQLRVQDNGNCLNVITFVIPEAQQLQLDLGPDPTIRIGDSVLLEGLANFVIDSVVWSPDSTLSTPDAASTYARPLTTNGFSLTAFDRNGCRVSDQVIVYVQRMVDVFVPNAFSPNGDGVNDKLVVLTERKIEHIRSFSIFSRWGEEVFFASDFPPNDPTYGWDGTHRGSALNTGVFVYYLEVVYPDGGVELLKGDVLLMR